MGDNEKIIAAIEIGSSKIAGIAGKTKDGTMQIIAYAEDRTPDCVKRGVVYNIEKTTLSIKNVVSKLESTMKLKVSGIYVGLGGQSVHSEYKVVQNNLQTPTCVSQTHIDTVINESQEVLRDGYELIGSYPQEFVVDSNVAADPVGVVGTHLEGRFVNVIANRKLKNNINTCFDNTDIRIVEFKVAACELANNVLSDTEKRSGAALIDLGASTTTIVIYKNNIVRLVSTIPLGFNNIIQDLCSLQIERSEAEELFHKYGNGYPEFISQEGEEIEYTTSDGRSIEITRIQHIIMARLTEILSNVRAQLSRSEYVSTLLGGIVITGGGSNLKNIERAVMRQVNIDKVRIARTLEKEIIKNSQLTNLVLDDGTNNTIISLLLSGEQNCVGGEAGDPDFFVNHERDLGIGARQESAVAAQKKEDQAVTVLESIKSNLREVIFRLQQQTEEILDHETNKRVKNAARALIDEANELIGSDYENVVNILVGKDKYKQILREAQDLIARRDEEITKLEDALTSTDTSVVKRMARWINDMLNEKD